MSVSFPHGQYAIVGMGCRFPGGANSPQAFWQLLREGRDAITEVPSNRPDWQQLYDPDPAAPGRIYARFGGFVDDIDKFDARFFGISPREASRIDPQQRLLLEVVWHAFEDASIAMDKLAGSDTGVFVGISTHDYADVQMYPANRDAIDAHSNTGGATAIAANRISYVYDLRGPSFTVDSACSSALTAVHLACRALDTGDCSLAIAGGVQLLLRPELTIGFCRATMLSVDGRCKAFDQAGDGYVRSEGAGAVVLKPLDRALADGDRIYAVVQGSAINQDGHSAGLTVPSEESQKAMLRGALRRAGLQPNMVQYVEAHGTGTAVGDPIEARAIGSVFVAERPDTEPLRLGSVKTSIGHLEAASGMAGLIKTALAINNRQLPPSLHFNAWNPAIDAAALKLKMVTALEDWPKTKYSPTAVVNSFGFGGANASVVLAAAPEVAALPQREEAPQAEILTLSARSPEALRALAMSQAELLLTQSASAAAICGAAALGRAHHDHRVAVVGATREALSGALDSYVAGENAPGIASGRASTGAASKLAFVFAGMGPQWWGMGRQLLQRENVFIEMMERCDAALRPYSDWSLIDEFHADEARSRLAHPQLAQVTNFALQVSLAAIWKSWGIRPDAVVGHSGGAMAAAYEAGVHSLEDAIWLAFHRSRLQGRDSNAGEMLAVGLPASEASELIRGHEAVVSLAAVNGPNSMTLAGDGDTLRGIAARLTERQVFARMLAVTIAYHSPKMDPIKDEFLQTVNRLPGHASVLPFVSDTTGTWENGADCDAAYWWRAIRQPVRFAESMMTLIEAGYTGFVEVSPHPVLAVSMGECLAARGVKGLVVPTLRRNEDERTTMLRSLGTLYANGAAPDWSALYQRDTAVALPLYPFQRERHWFEPGGDGEEAIVETAGEVDANPLLGRRLVSAQPSWEARLDGLSLDYLRDHVIQNAVIFPGAGYVAMALAAVCRLKPDSEVAIRDISFLRPLVLSDAARTRLQIIVDPAAQTFHVHGGAAADRSAWEIYSSGRISSGVRTPPQPLDIEALKAGLGAPHQPSDFYLSLQRRGLAYGARFKAITELRFRDGEALARIGPIAELPEDRDGVQPALLDAAFQLLAVVAASSRPDDDRLFLPTHIDDVRLYRPAGDSFWAQCRLETLTGARVVGSFDLVDLECRPVLSVHGFQAQLVEATASDADALNQWLYDYRWEPKAIEIGDAAPRRGSLLPADIPAVASQAPTAIARIESETGWPRYYTEAEPILSDYAAALVLAALAELGLPVAPGATLAAASIGELKAKEPSGGLWIERLLGLLIETGCVEAIPNGFRVLRVPPRDGYAERLPGYETDLALLAQAGKTLPGALAGGSAGKDAVFTTETLPLLVSFYRDAPASSFYNRILAEVVGAMVSKASAGGCLRVLEVGAGTGGATSILLDLLPQDRTRYQFTDAAPLLLEAARDRFKDVACLRTSTFDLAADIEGQGLQPCSFDLIVAANVIHAIPNIQDGLRRLRELLLPGGSLVLVEITRHPCWLDVIFGQTRGWWSFTDRALRSAHPLLESAQWRAQLETAGFENVWVSAEPGALGEAAQSVILATEPRNAESPVPWLVLADDASAGEALSGGLRSLGHEAIKTTHADIVSLLDSRQEVPAGIVCLWSLRGGDDFSQAQSAGVHAALSLIQAVLARAHLQKCPIYLVTAGAMRLSGDASDQVLHATLWGLGRTVLKEHPELAPRLLDVGTDFGPTEIDALLRELTEHDPDEEIALRGRQRHVRRLRRTDLRELRAPNDMPAADAMQWRAEIGKRGSLASLRVREFRPAELTAHDVQIDIRAASLNFRDVMLAMGGIPGLEDELSFGHQHLGSDCAGVVTAVGADVASLRPGDTVMGMAPGAIGSMSMTSSTLVVRKPQALTMQEAASVPTVFLTAWYALAKLARVRKGEKILIHAATGGVGLAAIQIARDAGAEIFATAGSEAKRDYLRSIGISHVMGSRSLDFADEIRERTGGRGVDIVLNSLTGEAVERGIACLRPYGRFLEIGKLDIYTNQNLQLGRFRQNLSYFAIDLDRLCAERPDMVGEMLQEIVAAFEAGRFQPLPRHDFGMPQLEDAFRLMAQAKHVGKIVLTNTDERPPIDVVGGLDRVLRRDGSYLITGGLGGFGLEVAEYLASGRPGAIVLMGRSSPSPDAAKRIEALRAAGVTVEVMRGDVSREADLDAILGRIKHELPPLAGIFHGAMVLDDRKIEDMDADSLDAVLAPKALGAWHLHRRTVDQPLDLFVMFSSISSILGNPLQANYGAASTFLDALAQQRRAAGLPALSINWGVLAEFGYVAQRPELQQFLEQQGYRAFKPKQALAALGAMLDRDAPQVMIANIDWRRLAAYSPRAAASPRIAGLIPTDDSMQRSSATSEIAVALATASADQRLALIEAFVAKVLGRVLGIAPADIEADKPFDELGLDSLLAVEFMVVLTGALGFEMPVIALLDGMTVRKMAGLMQADLDLGEPKRPVAMPPAAKAEPTATNSITPVIESPPTGVQLESGVEPIGTVAPPPSAPRIDHDLPATYASLDYTRWSPMQTAARAISRAGFATLGKVSLEGLDNLPREGPFILAVNHLSMADVPLALTVIPRRTIILATSQLQRWFALDWLVGRIGQAIYVPKGGDPAMALESALQVLESGGVLALAPEGVRSRTGLKRAQTGVAWLAQKSRLPVIPYAAWGQERWRERFLRCRRLEIAIRIGQPIPPPTAAGDDAQLREYADSVMAAIARMLPPSYRGAYADAVRASGTGVKVAA